MEDFLVVCTNSDGWEDEHKPGHLDKKSHHPKKGDILTVIGIKKVGNIRAYYFKEIDVISQYDGDRECYDAIFFKRIYPQSFSNKLTKMLANKGIVKEGIEIIKIEEPISHE